MYAGKSAEDRLDARRRALVEAAIELIATRGLADTTVRGVCEAAGLSTRFFYESFDGLDALALAAYDECVQSAFATTYAAAAAVPGEPAARARGAVGAIVDYLETQPQRARLMLVEGLGAGPLAQKRRDTMALLRSVIAMLGRETYGRSDEQEPLVDLAATLVAGGVVELMVARLDGALELPRERFIDDCAALIVAVGDTAAGLARER
jgi:AcrR family transcriptional regulator